MLFPDGRGVRASARITRLASSEVIWADNLDLAADSVANNVELLVRRIAAAALPRLHDDLLSNLGAQPQDAYGLYLGTKVRMHGHGTFEEAREVAAEWEALIASHPRLSQAYPPLIRLYDTDYCFTGLGASGPEERRRAYELAHKAIEIDPADAHLHTVKGWCHLWAGEAPLARPHLEEALALNPYNQARLLEVATALMFLDELDAAAELLDRRRELTAFATEPPYLEQGLLHLLRGEFEAAAAQLTLARRRHPDDRPDISPTIMAELYAVLAAAGAGSGDLAARADRWRKGMAARWRGAEPLDAKRLSAWILFHNPLQSASRRTWLLGLADKAMAAADALGD